MQENEILVSVVIPTYSRNITLTRAIDSVLAQTYKNLEIIVVDDNPPDSEWRASTQHIMKEYSNNPRIRYIQNAQNMGGSGARNEGIKAANGEYIAFLDDDDEYFPEKVEKQLRCFLNTTQERLALVFCDAVMTYESDKIICYLTPRYRGCCLFEAMRDNCLAPTSQWLAKKSALIDVGMFSIVPNKQDSTLILKLLDRGYTVECVEEILSKYCSYGDARISNITKKSLLGEIAYMEKCRKLFYKLAESQIIEVEYAFAKKLFDIYRNLNMKDKMLNEVRKMIKINKKGTMFFLIRSYIWRLGHRIKTIVRWCVSK